MHFNLSRGLIRLDGKDSLDLLNRLSTNKTNPLSINQFVNTVLLNEKGRIIDLVTVFYFGDYVLLLTSSVYTLKVKEYLDKYIIMDDVNVTVISDKLRVTWEINSNNTEVNNFINEDGKIAYTDNLFFNKKITIYLNESFEESVNSDFELFRIDNMIPVAPNELNENTNPLECGLKSLISFSKGCYIGQEVIARLDAQDKIPKKMKRFESEENVKPGFKIYYSISGNDEKKECGVITSFEKNKGLLFIRSVTLEGNYDYYSNTNNKFNKINFN